MSSNEGFVPWDMGTKTVIGGVEYILVYCNEMWLEEKEGKPALREEWLCWYFDQATRTWKEMNITFSVWLVQPGE